MNYCTNNEKRKREEDEIKKKVDELDKDQLPTANILVAGITGTGKSTLVNAVFGDNLAETGTGKPVTSHMNEYSSPRIPICIWDTVGLELDSQKTKSSIDEIKKLIVNKSLSENQFDRIHAIWYCINSGSNRYQGAELDFIKSLYKLNVPFIIVLTQCIGAEEDVNAFEGKIREINASEGMDDIDIVQVIAKEYKTRMYTIPAYGLKELVETTMDKLSDFIVKGFVAAQNVCKLQKREQCEEIIYTYVKSAKEGFWDKIPLANIFVANKRIMNMFKKIGQMYCDKISPDVIDTIIKESRIDFKNVFAGLIDLRRMKYNEKVKKLLNIKKREGFQVNIDELSKSDRVANMVALYGYTFIYAVEKAWEKTTKENIKNMNEIVDVIIDAMNDRLAKCLGNSNSYTKLI